MKEIDNIVKKVLIESLNEKADELAKKINGEMEEDFGPEDYDYEEEDMPDYRRFRKLLDKKLGFDGEESLADIELEEETDVMHGGFDYVQEKECMEGDCGEMEEGERFKKALKSAYEKKHPDEKFPASLKKKYSYDDEEDEEEDEKLEKSSIEEKLFGNQHKIDVAQPKGKITKADFDKLRSKNKVNEKWEGDTQVEKTGEYSNMSVAQLDKMIKVLKSKTAKMQDEGKKVPKSMREKMSELYFAKRAKQGWKGKGSAKVDEEMEEGNAFTGALAKAKEEGKDSFKVGNKEFDVKNESYKYSITFGGEELILSENELVNMIEEIILEDKKSNLKSSGGRSKGIVEYDRVHKKDEDINKKANQESFKKMKDYVKAGSKGSFEENPKDFPKGNGELGEMSKKAYIPSDAVEEYVSDFAYPGQTNLTFDEIKPDDEKIEKYLKGDATTGNSQEYANAVPSKTGEKFFKNYKDNAYGAEQKEASYKRVTAPVDVAGENKGSKTYKKTKGQKALDKLSESTEEKVILSEEMERMKKLLSYNKKTQ